MPCSTPLGEFGLDWVHARLLQEPEYKRTHFLETGYWLETNEHQTYGSVKCYPNPLATEKVKTHRSVAERRPLDVGVSCPAQRHLVGALRAPQRALCATECDLLPSLCLRVEQGGLLHRNPRQVV